MGRIILATALLSAAFSSAAEEPQATYVPSDQVAKGGAIASAPNFSILLARRSEAGMSEIHDKETDTFYVLDGSATLVVGGTMIGSSETSPGQHRGTGIEGGKAQVLGKGDVVVIPPGVPHWFSAVPSSIEYYIVKVIEP